MPSYTIELNNQPDKGSNENKLMLRITVDRKHARIALDYSVHKKHFNPTPKQHDKYIRKSCSKYVTINDHIDKKIQKAKDTVDELEKESKLITAKTIKERMVRPKSSSFFDYSDKQIADLKKNNNIGNWKKFMAVINKLKEYRAGEDLMFLEIDVSFLEGYQSYLQTKGNKQSTIHANFRVIRVLYYKAIKSGLIQQANNPFFSFKLKSSKPSRVRLNEDEIAVIENLDLPKDEFIWHVWNAFLFSFYTAGMRASDIILLKWANIKNGRLVYQMRKTKKQHSVKLIDKAKKVLSYYGPNEPEEYVFPFFSSEIDYTNPTFIHNQISSKTAIINKYLKEIATKAGIDKNISTHTARHSFADIARKKTDNIYNLSKTLGHSDLKVTEAYLASFDDEAVDSTMDDVFK